MRVHRASQGSGVFMLTDAELAEMAAMAHAATVEISLFARPNAAWDTSAMARSPAGGAVAAASRGQEQIVQGLADARRAAAAGVRSVLIADVGLLDVFAEARRRDFLPADMQAKVSVMLPVSNPATARALVALGADTLNLTTDLSLAQIAAIRAVVDVPLDIYVEVPDNVGGFVRLHEIPEIVRVAAPVYLKFGLRNAPDVYPAGTHLEATTVALTRERVRRARLGHGAARARVGRLRDLRARRSRARARAGVSADVVTLGEALVALVADEGRPLVDPGSFTPFVAGAEANVAMGLARLGRAVSFIGRVGADGLGQMVRNGLRGEGVDVSRLRDDPAAPTGALARDRRSLPPAEVVYLRRGSAASQLEPADVEAAGEDIAGARWLHLTGITPALSPSCRAAVQSALEIARAGGVRVSLDVNLRRRLWSEQEAAAVLRELAEGCDLVIAGEDEAVLLCGSAEAAALAERFGVEAVVKLGARGAVGWRNGEWAEDAGIAVAPIDVVGAGDAFTAGYLDALLDGAGLAESLRRANACGAIAVASVGDATGLPTRSELERVLAGGADVVR